MQWPWHSNRDRRRVFVACGRDEAVRERMFDFLRALDLRPWEWEPLVAASRNAVPFLGDVVRRAPTQAQATLVLMTPDDVVQLHPHLRGVDDPDYETGQSCQPRANVLIELGLALMASPKRTIIVELGALRPIADLGGRNVIRFDGSPGAAAKLVERLRIAGCAIDDRGGDWRNPGRFTDLDAYRRRPPQHPTKDVPA
jgi:predicted nucleotide-binding protein